jgi:hypothetical protein
MLERIFIPIAPYLFITAGLSACLYMFYSLQRELHELSARCAKQQAEIDAAKEAARQIDEMRAELREAEQRTAQLIPPPPLKSGLNLNKRTQVIRMFRHGSGEELIASKLGLPRNEVKLLLKVHNLAVKGGPQQGPQSDADWALWPPDQELTS